MDKPFKPAIMFSDLDGTLLSSNRTLSPANEQWMRKLGQYKIVRVISTGRSLYSFLKLGLTTKQLEIDYLIFSTGAGIMNMKDHSMLQSYHHDDTDIRKIAAILIDQKVDFMVHHPVPENHRFTYYKGTDNNPDFASRIKLYDQYATPFTEFDTLPKKGTQIIAIFPDNLARFKEVKEQIHGYQVTRTTSPLDHTSIWMEIFPSGVSKGTSCNWLCNHLGISQQNSVSIGNDYNDLSMLDFTQQSYVVATAPTEMLALYTITSSNDDDGFARAMTVATKGFPQAPCD